MRAASCSLRAGPPTVVLVRTPRSSVSTPSASAYRRSVRISACSAAPSPTAVAARSSAESVAHRAMQDRPTRATQEQQRSTVTPPTCAPSARAYPRPPPKPVSVRASGYAESSPTVAAASRTVERAHATVSVKRAEAVARPVSVAAPPRRAAPAPVPARVPTVAAGHASATAPTATELAHASLRPTSARGRGACAGSDR